MVYRKPGILLALACVLLCAVPLFAQPERVPRLPIIDQIHETYVQYDVNGVTSSDGSIYVSIATKDGQIVFESRFPVIKADGKYLEWHYLAEPGFSMSRRLGPNAVRTVQGMTFAAKDIVKAIRRGHVDANGKFVPRADSKNFAVKADDNYGCDWPFDDMSCTANGNCCDTHDACYLVFNCDALSWLGLESPMCTACNEAVVACITLGIFNNGQPSECCAAGNCGQERPPNYYQSGGGFNLGNKTWEELFQGDGGGGGGGGTIWELLTTPWGQVIVGGGECWFPNGDCIPCG